MLKIDSINFSYGKKRVLENISLSVGRGEMLVLLGANGAGKSTLMKIVSGFLKADSGCVIFDGNDIAKKSPKELANFRAVLEQECPLAFDYSVLETVKLGGFARKNCANLERDALESLEKVGLGGFAERRYSELSGGEKRRVHMARSLCQIGENPENKLLLLDEPSAGLDPMHSHIAMQSARDTADKGAVVCAVLHDVNLASAYADKIALLKNGKLLKYGNVPEILDEKLLSDAYDSNCALIKNEKFKYPFVHFLGAKA
jgi:iron complex transport system ATP-binding protein